ncbi:transmembrane protein 252 [Pteronotus mesoamericanus]|uniref:transmembrane protein 252 n=1 Tax=Pteronotus mesoamericanus TaxID=1884717 RepID=UPI0023EC2893|nr:transmembrane protein 252 [Pteronotus parnellii mesoamericanus]
MRNRTGTVLCAFALLAGFLVVCLGAFFMSWSSIVSCQENLIMAYLLLPLGFVILLGGISWSTYRQASGSKGMFSHVLRQHLAQGAEGLATVDRPDFYPPAYEESLDVEKKPFPAEREALEVPPPLYTETDLEFEDESDAHQEAPPSYDESMVDRAAAATPSQDAERQSQVC